MAALNELIDKIASCSNTRSGKQARKAKEIRLGI